MRLSPLYWVVLGALSTLAACGGAAVPQEQLTSAKAASSGAEVGGAAEDPKAALHLKLAKEGIAEAERLIEEGDNEEAERALWRAQVDAELALTLAKQTKAKAEASEANEQL